MRIPWEQQYEDLDQRIAQFHQQCTEWREKLDDPEFTPDFHFHQEAVIFFGIQVKVWRTGTEPPYAIRTRPLAIVELLSTSTQLRGQWLDPASAASPSGYRLYTQQHLAALKTVKSMVCGYGWPRTSAIMQALHRGDLSAALAMIDERHAELARKRLQME